MNKFSKKELIGAIKNMKPKETNIVRQNGKIEVIAKGDEIETLPSKEITLKSIYNLMTTKFESIDKRFDSIDALIIKNQEDNNERFESIDKRFDSIDNEIKNVKADVNNLDTKLNKVIELNNLKF